MKIKELKLEFFVPFKSNHPNHIKINIVQNMVKRAVVLCSNKNLFFHTYIALRIRFQKSGYPNSFLLKFMDINLYNDRKVILSKINNNSSRKINAILQFTKIKYKPTWIPNTKEDIFILYDKILTTSQYL